ncbi:DnaJ-like protein subfamily C member 2 [Hypsibius exemplaris]|uniref:DnaJ-like protein subfamily C member 2 n=1 Tax=Hypsibius exemplaris TaxID=2072580 RepID=A0A1W0WS87_HYPEX|nr:DnaJ-like protein subfamily C member 2 [Hypsibius exemplaris]
MHVSSETAVLLAKEVKEQRDYFYNTFLRPFCEPKRRQAKSKPVRSARNDRNYIHGQTVEIPFKISHKNQEDYLKKLDPAQWKDQDHYLVLGLGELRYRASDEDVKKAHKRLILKHHPDKRRQQGVKILDETKDYFACLTKAFEILGDPEKRRAYDSVDQTVADVADDVPDKLEADEKDEFFETFASAFLWNSRWSSKQPVPQLGDMNAKEDYINEFYDFWYDFDSWRDYSYMDEPVTGEDRWERRHGEKENKEAQRKSKETARIRRLVDNAFASDPRIAKLRDEEKKRKEADKQARKELQRQKAEQEEQQKRAALEKEQEAKRLLEEAAKQESERIKKEREADKKVLKKERKTLRDLLKGWNYFTAQNGSQLKVMQETERLCEALSGQELQELNQKMTAGDVDAAKAEFSARIVALDRKAEAGKAAELKEREERESRDAALKQQAIDEQWSEEEHKLLIRAVTQYPAGTQNRWDVVAEFINHHVFLNVLNKEAPRKKKLAKDVIAKMKNLKQIEMTHEAQKMEANSKAFDQFVQKQKPVLKPTKDDNSISENFDEEDSAKAEHPAKADQQPVKTGQQPAEKPWSAAEQKQLEQCLKKFPPTDPQRFENMAKEMGTRTADECKKRFKELVAKIKAQKAAASAGGK